ncbi:MAG: DEAD/DEAH box helicase, partial [Eggerthellaceae bacterium]|nr:DEAD/DEAH box helicase [Eggerthellaceae bacterium]
PFQILAGVGVALKVIQALGSRLGQPHLWREYTDFAALGTIADLMPMREDNRALVADGVAKMNEAPRPCIAALLACAGAIDKPVASTSLSFSVIPRLNAAGRMGDAQLSLDLLLTDDFDEANRLAAQLEQVNDQRRAIEAELVEIAMAQAQETYHGQRALVVSGDGWHEGVKGIVASRLVRTYGVPVILFTIDEDGQARGSGRSVGQVNLFKAVESCADILTRYGGHEAAVGVTLSAESLDEFANRLCEYMDGLPEDNFHPRVDVDACVDLGELTLENVASLDMLAPFGQENRQPRFLARDVLLTKCRAVGADKNHLSCLLTDGCHSVSGIMFHCSDIDMLMHCDCVVNAAFEAQVDEWRGRKTVKAMLRSVAPARMCAALEACIDPDQKDFVADLYATGDDDLVADDVPLPDELEEQEAQRERNRREWEARAAADPEGLRDEIVRALIGTSQLFDAQQQVLAALEEGESVLTVMATGRGKSLTFHAYAAEQALSNHQVSLFVYPLRALIADQAFHLSQALGRFGISCEMLTGESTPEERRAIFSGMRDGSVDIVLTTPEFLDIHAGEFAQTGRVGFVVVDEAHHVGLAKAGNRPAYAHMSRAINQLGAPRVLALTATASASVAKEIESSLGITCRVLDRSTRPNLQLVDQRNMRYRESYLANLIASGEKTVIFVNSRQQSVALARQLRKLVPQIAPFIGFYNAGLGRVERIRIEELFRTGGLQVLVSTSAFGEGVNIADIRNVVLYHMPFNEVEFNQMSGRAGRDGLPAQIHLLFGRDDAGINQGILFESTPDHDVMAVVYRELRAMQRAVLPHSVHASNVDIANACNQRLGACNIGVASVACAVAVFRELGLIETRSTEGGDRLRAIRVVNTESKVELTDSVRYREGLDEMDIFQAFCQWVLGSTEQELSSRVCAPILPDEV